LLGRIPLTIRHRFEFGAERDRVGSDLINPESWDAIRETVGPFGLPATRADWERSVSEGDFAERAVAIAEVADQVGARTIASYGVGAAFVELALTQLRPELDLVCTDYAPRTIERLSTLFPEADVRRHDLLRDEPLDADLHLFHRIDSELSNREWRTVLPRFRQPVLLVATQLLELGQLRLQLAQRSSPTATDAGYIRTEAALRSLWRRSHRDRKVQIGSHAGFVLTPRRGYHPPL
jgi:hypothetical protein